MDALVQGSRRQSGQSVQQPESSCCKLGATERKMEDEMCNWGKKKETSLSMLYNSVLGGGAVAQL